MKILVVSDIHGNISAIKGLEKRENLKEYDYVFSLGDVIVDYPHPNECIEWVNNNTTPIIGNNDMYICDHLPARWKEFSKWKTSNILMQRSLIREENKTIVNSWKKSYLLEVDGIKLYFTHYVWDKIDDVVSWDYPVTEEGRKDLFNDIDADYIFFGHEHEGNYFTDGKKHYYCCASLGLRNPSRYLVIEINKGIVNVETKEYLHDFDIENRLEFELLEKNKKFFE